MEKFPGGTTKALATATAQVTIPSVLEGISTTYTRKPGFHPCVAFDWDGVMHEHGGYRTTWGKIDTTLIDMAHARKFAVAIQTCNDTWRIANLLAKRGYKVQDDNARPVSGSLRGSPSWYGGEDGYRILVTNRKVCAKFYVDDRGLQYDFRTDPREVFVEIDRRRGFWTCVDGQKGHYGAYGAAGTLPWAIGPDGRIWVLLNLRGRGLQNGGTWSTSGGAVEPSDADTWTTAMRETGEETRGLVEHIIPVEDDDPGHVHYCPHGCGWFYQTFPVQVTLTADGKLPVVTVGRSGSFETTVLRWFPLQVAQTFGPDELHPGLRASFSQIAEMIKAQAAETATV